MDGIHEAGARLVALSPQTQAKSRELVAARRLRFPLLRDGSNEVAEAFGLRWSLPHDLRELYLQFGIDLKESNGEGGWTLPVPARYVIDTDGVVRSAAVDVDYTVRPEPEKTLEVLRTRA